MLSRGLVKPTGIAVAAVIIPVTFLFPLTSRARTIDSIPPRVTISSPSHSDVISGTQELQGSARDNRRVARVEVQIDSSATRTVTGTTGWSYPLDTRAVEDGNRVVKATAYDTVGNASSTSIVVEVRNGGALTTGASGGEPVTTDPASGSGTGPGSSSSESSSSPLPSAPPLGEVSEPAAPASAASTANVAVQAASPWSAVVSWKVPSGASSVQITRDGLLLENAPSSAGSSMTDRLLWPERLFTYRVRVLSSSGAALYDESAAVTTPRASAGVPRLYSSTSFWNQSIASGAAVDPASGAMIQKSIVAYRGSANFSNSKSWGVPLAYATELSKNYNVACTRYDCGTAASFRIPSYAKPASGTDAHMTVIDPATGAELDAWQARPSWSASSRYLTSSKGSGALCAPGQRCNSANAAGFALLGGVVRPEEVAQGHIDHALFITTPLVRSGYIACPATHTDGQSSDPSAVPEGARIQLDPSFNVDAQSWPRWQKVIAKALQTYGAYVGDFGGSLSIRGESLTSRNYDAWSLAGVSGSGLSSLPWERFRVLKMQKC